MVGGNGLKNLLNGPLRQDRKALAFGTSVALGAGFGLACAGLPLVGALWALAVLSLTAAVGNGFAATEGVSGKAAIRTRSSCKTLGDD